MANTNILVIYIMILVIFNFFAGGFVLSQDSETFNLQKYMIISNTRSLIFEDSAQNIFTSFVKVVTAPFLIIDVFLFLFVIIGTGVSILPSIVNIFLFTPLGILIIFDYVLPMIRGN